VLRSSGDVFGGFFLALGVLITVILLSREDAGLKFLVGTFMSGGAAGAMALTALAAPRWARTQEQRVEHISRFAAALLANQYVFLTVADARPRARNRGLESGSLLHFPCWLIPSTLMQDQADHFS
jgi:hypothetical protein